MGCQNVSDVISSCILSDLTPRSSYSGLELQCLGIPVGMSLSMKNLGAKETRQQLFQPGRRGCLIGQKQHEIHAKTVDQNCISWISVLYFPNVLTQIKFCVGPQRSESQALRGTNVFHEVWGSLMGDFNGFNTQIHTFSSDCKGQINAMFSGRLILLPLSWDRYTGVVRADLL